MPGNPGRVQGWPWQDASFKEQSRACFKKQSGSVSRNRCFWFPETCNLAEGCVEGWVLCVSTLNVPNDSELSKQDARFVLTCRLKPFRHNSRESTTICKGRGVATAVKKKGLDPFPFHGCFDGDLTCLDHPDVTRVLLDRDGISPCLKGGCASGPASREAIEDDVAGVREDLDESARQKLRLLRRMLGSLVAVASDAVAHDVGHALLSEEIERPWAPIGPSVIDKPDAHFIGASEGSLLDARHRVLLDPD